MALFVQKTTVHFLLLSFALLLTTRTTPMLVAEARGRRPPKFGGYYEVLPTPRPSGRSLRLRKFAKIPNFGGRPAKIVGMVSWRGSLYVTTSVSGGYVWRVDEERGEVSLWMNVTRALQKAGRVLYTDDPYHGGVRGIAFHPRNQRVYLSLVEKRTKPFSHYRYLSRPMTGRVADGDSVLLEFRTHGHGENKNKHSDHSWRLPVLDSLREVLRVGLRYIDHPIKQLVFKDRLLYIGHGDGSVHSTILGTGQDTMDALGKILRIDPSPTADGEPYSIPPWNPFYKRPGYLGEIYAYGFRNPHTLCIAQKKPRDVFAADAGRDNVEEVNIVKPGRNYGWSKREGPFVHVLKGGGLKLGVEKLPRNDADFNLTYPNVALGHYGNVGWGFKEAKQAIAAGCPIENDSELNGLFFYTNFPSDGNMYFSYTQNMRYYAVTQGLPKQLRQAPMFKARILFDRDGTGRSWKALKNMRDVILLDRTEGTNPRRADTRIGRGHQGQMYISSKQNGMIYVAVNSYPKSK